ncbi:MAG TPA: phage tail tape measure protein, partial [Pirellulales bacterium]|jgi:hypothetical protein|nr:phage tail tape measure protein [Pirellulales bacterium]
VKLQNENSKATAEGARDMFHAAGGAMLAHPLSHADLGAFKAAAPEMRRAGLSVDEQLAFFGTAKQRLGGDAGTAASFTTTFLDKLVSQRGAGKMKAEGLMALGLDLQNVDLKGEDLQEVLDRLAGGLAKLDEAAKLPALGKIFGAGNALKAQEVIENRGDFAQFLQENAQAAPLAETAATRLTQTDAARIARAKARQEKEAAAHGDPAVETARAVMEEMLEETNANAVQRFAARRMFQFAGGTQGIEEWLKGQKLNPEQQRAQATQRAMASVEFAVDMKPEQTAEMAGRMGLLDREPEEERGAVAARQRGGQSDLIGPERLEAAADKKKLAGEMKKRDTERKQNATELAHAEKALADFGERQELHEALDEARKLDDEENQDEQEAFKRRQRAVSDDEFRQRHPAKARPKGLTDAEWMKRQAGMFRPAEHVELAHPKATHTHAEAVQAGELAAQLREKEEAVAAAKAAVEEGRKQKERDDKQNALLERIAKGVERRDDPNRAKARPPL